MHPSLFAIDASDERLAVRSNFVNPVAVAADANERDFGRSYSKARRQKLSQTDFKDVVHTIMFRYTKR